MSTAAKHDPDTGYEPAFAAPKNACDAHFHVFGARGAVPLLRPRPALQAALRAARSLHEARPAAGLRALRVRAAERLRLRQLLHARRHGRGGAENCAAASSTSTRPSRTTRCWASGMRRACAACASTSRRCASPRRGSPITCGPRSCARRAICRELGWHLDFLLPGWLISELWAR